MADEPCDREPVALEKEPAGRAELLLAFEQHLGDGDGVEAQAFGAEREVVVERGAAGSMGLHDRANDVSRIHGANSKLRLPACARRAGTGR